MSEVLLYSLTLLRRDLLPRSLQKVVTDIEPGRWDADPPDPNMLKCALAEVPNTWLPSLVEQDRLVDLTGWAQETKVPQTFHPQALELCGVASKPGTLYGVPIDLDVRVLWVSSSALDKAQAADPTAFFDDEGFFADPDSLVRFLKRLKRMGITSPLAFPLPHTLAQDLHPFVYAMGGEYLYPHGDPNGVPAMASPKTQAALAWLRDLHQRRLLSVREESYEQTVRRLVADKPVAGVFPGALWCLLLPGAKDGITPLLPPAGERSSCFVGATCMVMLQSTPTQERDRLLAAMHDGLCERSAALDLHRRLYTIPAHTGAWRELRRGLGRVGDIFDTALERATPILPQVPHTHEAQAIINRCLQDLLEDNTDKPQERLAQCDRQLSQLLVGPPPPGQTAAQIVELTLATMEGLIEEAQRLTRDGGFHLVISGVRGLFAVFGKTKGVYRDILSNGSVRILPKDTSEDSSPRKAPKATIAIQGVLVALALCTDPSRSSLDELAAPYQWWKDGHTRPASVAVTAAIDLLAQSSASDLLELYRRGPQSSLLGGAQAVKALTQAVKNYQNAIAQSDWQPHDPRDIELLRKPATRLLRLLDDVPIPDLTRQLSFAREATEAAGLPDAIIAGNRQRLLNPLYRVALLVDRDRFRNPWDESAQ